MKETQTNIAMRIARFILVLFILTTLSSCKKTKIITVQLIVTTWATSAAPVYLDIDGRERTSLTIGSYINDIDIPEGTPIEMRITSPTPIGKQVALAGKVGGKIIFDVYGVNNLVYTLTL